MGSNVFGTPINTEMLKAMPEYHDKKSITAADRALMALEMKNAEGKDMNARRFLENLQSRFSDDVSTMCMIYNATGDPLTLVESYNWKGRICESPYPMIILNGQWGVFLHGRWATDDARSEGALVYHGLNLDWMVSFTNNPSGASNRVYSEILSPGRYDDSDWNRIKRCLDNEKWMHRGAWSTALIYASIGNTEKCAFEAIFTTKEALTS